MMNATSRRNCAFWMAVAFVAIAGSAQAQTSPTAPEAPLLIEPEQGQAVMWFDGERPTPLVEHTLALLEAATLDGLNPEDYGLSSLRQQVAELSEQGSSVQAREVLAGNLQAALTRFYGDLARGRVDVKQVHPKFDRNMLTPFDAQAHTLAALQDGNLGAAAEQAKPTYPLYTQLRGWLAEYRRLGNPPAWDEALAAPARGRLDPGDSYAQMDRLRERLLILGDMQPQVVQALMSQPDYDTQTVDAVRRFQARHGLTVDGIVGAATLQALNVSPAERVKQIELSMERLRWTPLELGERLLLVNIPGYTLYAYDLKEPGKFERRLQMPVILGRAQRHQTPVFTENMRYIEFSPYWNIPASIARNETMPKMESDPSYAARQGMEFVDSSGNVIREVTPENLDAVRSGQMRIRQRPGGYNALGGVKFAFPNNMNIYMHHTPSTGLFERSRRDFSHGCIRVEDPVALALYTLEGEDNWDESRVRAAMDRGRMSTVRLTDPIPVVIAYSTVDTLDDGTIAFFPDVYGHDKRLAQALSRARQ